MTTAEEVTGFVDDQRKIGRQALSDMVDIALYTEGSITLGDLKGMSPVEISIVTKRINRYFAKKNQAAKAIG